MSRDTDAHQPVPRNVPNDWQSLEELHSWKEQDYGEAKESAALLTLAELVNRFGSPSKVSQNGKGQSSGSCSFAETQQANRPATLRSSLLVATLPMWSLRWTRCSSPKRL